MKVLSLMIFICLMSPVWAQENSRGTGSVKTRSYEDLSSGSKEISGLSRRAYKKTPHYQFYKHHEDLIDEYHERMESNVRRYKKMARQMKKPQYSNWSYFGHKRKPKKRPVGKRKYCDECGIVH